MVLIFGSIQVAKRLGIDQPEKINQLRTLFVTTTIIFYTLGLVIRQIVISKKNTTPFEYSEPATNGQEQPTVVKTTIGEYDLGEINKLLKSSFMSTLIVSALHLYFKISQPLIVQSVLPLFSILKSPIFLVHVLGFSPTGEYERPWVVKSAFGNFESAPTPVDSAAAESTTASSTEKPAIKASSVEEKKKI
ncbi:hypothetical protein AYI68_g8233 [Smittium mucronatum]|uniref:Inorganic phosphate transport protein PHO88 n=1 Tax=Smittium mucronatum TaxID=133383 RepID=A0A1R0GLH2_9FUNG|nr:hypothetical protein AYI68_g8233 [Smittium mucronatum]